MIFTLELWPLFQYNDALLLCPWPSTCIPVQWPLTWCCGVTTLTFDLTCWCYNLNLWPDVLVLWPWPLIVFQYNDVLVLRPWPLTCIPVQSCRCIMTLTFDLYSSTMTWCNDLDLWPVFQYNDVLEMLEGFERVSLLGIYKKYKPEVALRNHAPAW